MTSVIENTTNNIIPTPVQQSTTAEINDMLSYCRPAGCRTEKKFIAKFIKPLGVTIDTRGNLSKKIGTAPIMWSCHTDTVHYRKGYQAITSNGKITRLPKDSFSNCLGADDTAGVWLMMEMIRANVPGLYIFHREEEKGGGGSLHMAHTNADALKEYHFAVALDRRGMTDVITHQVGGRCCSDDFARSLAAQLGDKFKPSDDGIFTDTANYTDLIGECTNIAVGYEWQHSSSELLDLDFLQRLRDRLCQIDVNRLDKKRKPGEHEPRDFGIYEGRAYGANNAWESYQSNTIKHRQLIGASNSTWVKDESGVWVEKKSKLFDNIYDDGCDEQSFAELIAQYPDVAADMFENVGYNKDDLISAIRASGYYR